MSERANSSAAMKQQMYEALRYSDPTFGNSANFVSNIDPIDQLGRNRMNTSIKAVRVKAGFLGQVIASNVEATILWESSPKKTLAKAEAAARKAQLRAAQKSFE